MRIGVAFVFHETNTYADSSTGPTDYDRFEIWHGDELTERWKGTATAPGGTIDAVDATEGAEMVPIYGAFAQPSGTINAPAYERLRRELLEGMRSSLPLDALVLSLHGAAVAEGVEDVEGDLIRAVREVVGLDLPIVGAFDLHGNITQEMADGFDGFFGFHLYPHEDMYDRGVESVHLVSDLLEKKVHPVTHVEHIPMLIPASNTDRGPAAEVNRLCQQIESRKGVIDCTLFHGFSYADVPFAGMAVVAITDEDRQLAGAIAAEVGMWVWDHREDFAPSDPSPEEAIKRALTVDGGPVVINEGSDNTGGGAPGDGTHLLRAMVDADLEDACFASIYDPSVAQQAHAAGPGSSIDIELGGKHGDLHGKPIQAHAYVKTVSDGRFVLEAFAKGLLQDLGKSARLQIDGVDVIVVSMQSQVFDPEIFLLHGIDVTRYKIVALKSSQHFRAGFRDIAREIISADTPGITTGHIDVFDRSRNRYPLWPLDPAATYPVQPPY